MNAKFKKLPVPKCLRHFLGDFSKKSSYKKNKIIDTLCNNRINFLIFQNYFTISSVFMKIFNFFQ